MLKALVRISILFILLIFLLIDLIFFHPRSKSLIIITIALILLRWLIIFLFPKFMGEYFLSEVNLIKRIRKSV